MPGRRVGQSRQDLGPQEMASSAHGGVRLEEAQHEKLPLKPREWRCAKRKDKWVVKLYCKRKEEENVMAFHKIQPLQSG